jgi:hypothetical protein
MSRRQGKASYWQDTPLPREQLVLIPTALEEVIAADHPDEILTQLDWTLWEAAYDGSKGQPRTNARGNVAVANKARNGRRMLELPKRCAVTRSEFCPPCFAPAGLCGDWGSSSPS